MESTAAERCHIDFPVFRFAPSNIYEMVDVGMITIIAVVIAPIPRPGNCRNLKDTLDDVQMICMPPPSVCGFNETTLYSSELPQTVDNPIRGSCLCTMLTRSFPSDPHFYSNYLASFLLFKIYLGIILRCLSSSFKFISESSHIIPFLLDHSFSRLALPVTGNRTNFSLAPIYNNNSWQRRFHRTAISLLIVRIETLLSKESRRKLSRDSYLVLLRHWTKFHRIYQLNKFLLVNTLVNFQFLVHGSFSQSENG